MIAIVALWLRLRGRKGRRLDPQGLAKEEAPTMIAFEAGEAIRCGICRTAKSSARLRAQVAHPLKRCGNHKAVALCFFS